MERRFPLRSLLVPALLLSAIMLTGLSALFFNRLDLIVREDLYSYGLQDSYDWAVAYWSYSRLLTACLSLAISVTGISIPVLLLKARTGESNAAKIVCGILIIVGMVSISFSAFFFYHIDYVVHHDLYDYGLQFSPNWVEHYWLYSRPLLGLMGIVILINGVSVLALLFDRRLSQKTYMASLNVRSKLTPVKLIPPIMISVGGIALAFAMNYDSSILSFIGLGLVFWGAVLFYIRPQRYVRQVLLDKAMSSSLEALGEITNELGYRSKGIYLPPEYFTDFDSTKVYIRKEKDAKLPTSEEMQKEQYRVFLQSPEAMLVTPPGLELARLFEKTLKTNFAKVDIQYLEQNLPRLLIELEIAQSVEMHLTDATVRIILHESVIKETCNETRKLRNVCGSLGCPLCSAIACALTKATGKPVIFSEDLTNEKDQTIEIEYRFL